MADPGGVATEGDDATIGPLVLTAPSSTLPMHSVHLVLKSDYLVVLFLQGATDSSVRNNVTIIQYSEIESMAKKAHRLTLGLTTDPIWQNITEPKVPHFVRSGFATIVLDGDRAFLQRLTRHFARHCPKVLIHAVSKSCILPRLPVCVKFTVPDDLARVIVMSARLLSTGAAAENDFFDGLGFHFAMPVDQLVIAALTAASSVTLLDPFQFTQRNCLFDGPVASFPTEVAWAILSSATASQFDHCPATVTAIRAVTAIEYPNFRAACSRLEQFIEAALWQDMKKVGQSGHFSFWLMKIHGQDYWTVPAVSIVLTAKDYFIVAFNIVPCDSYVRAFHQSHAGRFKEGQGHFWLPELFNAVLMLQKDGARVRVQFCELVGWNFDPELQKSSMFAFAMDLSVVVAKFASYLMLLERPPMLPKHDRNS
jgi:hypothetical protein